MSPFYTDSDTTDFNRRLSHFLEKPAAFRPLLGEILTLSRIKIKKPPKRYYNPLRGLASPSSVNSPPFHYSLRRLEVKLVGLLGHETILQLPSKYSYPHGQSSEKMPLVPLEIVSVFKRKLLNCV